MENSDYAALFENGFNIYNEQASSQASAAFQEWEIAGSLRTLSGHIKKITVGSEKIADFSQYVSDAFAKLDTVAPETLKGKIKKLKSSAKSICTSVKQDKAVEKSKLTFKETALRISQFFVGCFILAGISSGTIPALMLVGTYPLALTVGATTHLMTAAIGTAAVTYKGASLIYYAVKRSSTKTYKTPYDPNQDLGRLRQEINNFLVDEYDTLQVS